MKPVKGRTIFVFPFWGANPYLNMLYLASRAAGWNVSGFTRLEALSDVVKKRLNDGDIVHVHWTAPVTSLAATERDAQKRLNTFNGVLNEMADKGIKLIWTVHNEITHDSRFYKTELEIAYELADRADLIIQLHDRTADAVAGSYKIPREKLVTLRHASYLGQYPDSIDEVEARQRLGVAVGAPTVGFVGQIRPYKGIATLFSAVDRLAPRVDGLTMVLAGKILKDDFEWVDSALPRSVEIVRRSSFVPDEELALWLRATNVIVLPYRRVLNSGSMMLGATFGTPCVIPDDTPLADVYGDELWVTKYETHGDEVANLAQAIHPLVHGDRRAVHAANQFARRYTPYDMSRDFLSILDRHFPAVNVNGTEALV